MTPETAKLVWQRHLANAVAIAQEAKKIHSRVTLSSGIVLKLKDVQPAIIRRAMAAIREPEVPVWMNPDKGREEPNPNDPGYIAAMGEFQEARLGAYYKLLGALGTTVESVPEGWFRPEEDGWLEVPRFLGIEPDLTSSFTRYHEWLELYACMGHEDRNAITAMTFQRNGGITEPEVAEAFDWFRSATLRGIDSATSDTGDDPDGDSIRPADPGDGPGNGGAGGGETAGDTVAEVAEVPKNRKGRGDRALTSQ